MSSYNLAPMTRRVARWRLEVFNTLYSAANAKGYDVHTSFDPLRCGWLMIEDSNMVMLDIDHKASIREKPSGRIEILSSYSWMLGLELIKKAQAAILYDSYPTIDNQPSSATKIALCIDCTGMSLGAPVGYIDVVGTAVDETGSHTERVSVNGQGTYTTVHEWTAITDINPDFTNSNATLSVWGKVGTGTGVRECRLLCDTNGDGIYGVVHGGYIRERSRAVERGYERTTYELIGYMDFAQQNAYEAGYRCSIRCANFTATGQVGACSVSSANFRVGGLSCYIGDFDTRHPSGTQVTSTAHRCVDYVAGTEHLPFDGWTYNQYYAPITETEYEYYPPTYFKSLLAIRNMLNSIEYGKAVSRPWDLPMKQRYALLAGIDAVATTFVITGTLASSQLTAKSYIMIDDEIMSVVSKTASGVNVSVTVYRNDLYTTAVAHSAGAYVRLYDVAWSPDGVADPPLVVSAQLQELDIKGTVAATMESLAATAISEISAAEFFCWIDPFRQIQFTEFNLDSASQSGTLTITLDDVLEPPVFSLSSVINRVSAQVNLSQDYWIYCDMTAEASGLSGYDKSVKIFGRFAEEIQTNNLTAITPTTGYVDFDTYAKNYLKINAFPRLTQSITVECLVPDEHYWEDVDTSSDFMLPYLRYTDSVNHYISLLGTKIICPDFWKPKVDNSWQNSTFLLESIKTASTVVGVRSFAVTLTLTRQTTPTEWV